MRYLAALLVAAWPSLLLAQAADTTVSRNVNLRPEPSTKRRPISCPPARNCEPSTSIPHLALSRWRHLMAYGAGSGRRT